MDYSETLPIIIAEKNLDILGFLGIDTTNLTPGGADYETIDPNCFEDKTTGAWMYNFSEFTGDIEPNTVQGAIVTPQMEEYNKKKLKAAGIEI